MTPQDYSDIDAGDRNIPKASPPIMTAFDEKPLPPIKDSKDRPLPPIILDRDANMDRPHASLAETAGRGSRKVKKESSKNSLFNLFSRPKVEKLRGYAEPGLSLHPIHESISRAVSPEPRMKKQSSEKLYPMPSRPGTGLSFRAKDLPLRPSGEDIPRVVRRRSGSTPPPLFQAYAQSVKISKAQTTDAPGSIQASRRRRGSHDLAKKGDKPHRTASISSIQYASLPRKIFALTPTGCIMQYADQGMTERLPEKVLQLTSESVAFPSNIVPGEPFVLQVAQSADVRDVNPTSSVSLLSRMGLRGSIARKEVLNLFLVFKTSQEMDSWLSAVRTEIQVLGGDGELAMDEPYESEDEKDNEKTSQEQPVVGRQDLLQSPEPSAPVVSTSGSDDIRVASPRILKPSFEIAQSSTVLPTASHKSASSSTTIHGSPPRPRISPVKPKLETRVSDVKRESSIYAATTPHDSPMSGDESLSTVDPVRNQFPFKLRSSIYEGPALQDAPAPPAKPTNGSQLTPSLSSPMHTPKNSVVLEKPSKITSTDGDTRPDSIVTDLPLLWSSRVSSRSNTPTPSMKAAIEARQNDPRLRPLRTAEPNQSRRPITKPLNLPLKVNPSVAASDTAKVESPKTEETVSEKSSPASKQADGEASATRHPRRTSSVKLSLFPAASATPIAAPLKPIVPVKDMRSLRRPASLQVRADPAPFLSSARSASGTRQPLHKTPSTPSLRTLGTANQPSTAARPPSSSHKHNVIMSAETHSNAFIISRMGTPIVMNPTGPVPAPSRPVKERNEGLTALPVPKGRPKTASKTNTLPALDLGIPVIGLGPPAPPPDRCLPSLPSPPPVPPKVTAH